MLSGFLQAAPGTHLALGLNDARLLMYVLAVVRLTNAS